MCPAQSGVLHDEKWASECHFPLGYSAFCGLGNTQIRLLGFVDIFSGAESHGSVKVALLLPHAGNSWPGIHRRGTRVYIRMHCVVCEGEWSTVV